LDDGMKLGEGNTPAIVDDVNMQSFSVLLKDPPNKEIGEILLISRI